jgi:hypothetical protein
MGNTEWRHMPLILGRWLDVPTLLRLLGTLVVRLVLEDLVSLWAELEVN